MSRLFKYLKPFTLPLILLLVFVYAQVTTNLALPDYMAKIINEGIGQQNQSVIWHNGLIMLAIAFGGALCTVVVGYLAARTATGFARNLREALFRKIESFSLAEFNSFSTASLITRSTNDVQQVQMVFVMLLRLAVMAPFTGIEAIRRAYQTAPSMTWIMALAVAVLLSIIILLFWVALPQFKKLQELVDRLNLVTREILTGLRVIRAFNTEAQEEERFDQANKDLTRVNLFVNRLMVIMQPVMTLIMNGMILAIVWIGAQHIDTGNLMIGDMLAFMQYSTQVIFAFLMISIIFIMVPRASVAAQRIAAVLKIEPVITDPKSPIAIKTIKSGRVEFKDVTFTYPGGEAPALHHLNFTAEPGETTAIIGSTGSGKSTLINLIPRFYDATEGAVLVDGVNVKQFRLEELYQKIGYVPQKAVLFSGTIKSNLKYGAPKASTATIQQESRVAQADGFIAQLGGYESTIAQGGTNVSGGQKQRLSIARALIRKPEIYLFDDSFSALDYKTDTSLRRALAKETKDKTVIIVAQRISTILQAQKIIVLDEGKIVAQGTHSELLKSCQVYREIANSQLSAAELKGTV